MIGYLDKYIRPLVLTRSEMSGYVKTSKVEDKINKLMSFSIDDERLLEKYKSVSAKLNTLTVYDDRYTKAKLRTYGDKVYTNFRGLNVSFLLILCLYTARNITYKYI